MASAPSSPPIADETTERGFPVALQGLLPWRARAMAFADRHLTGMRGLVITGGALSAIYLLLTLAFPIWNWWYRVDDNLGTIPAHVSWGRPLVALAGPHQLNIWMTIIAFIVIVTLFGLQALALYAARTTRDVRATRRLVLGFAIAFVVIQVCMQPITSTDLYGYLARAYLTSQLHQNPTITLATFLQGGYLVPHARPPAPYGPLWLLLCWGVGLIAGENLLLAMVLMKVLVAAALISAIFLVAHLTDKLMPGGRIQSLIFFAWSPLLIFEAAGNGHNDMVMMVCVLASLAALQARRPFWAFPLLALGVLVKYAVGALVPLWVVMIFFVYCWRVPEDAPKLALTWPPKRDQFVQIRRRIDWRRVGVIFVGGGGLAVAIAALCYAPFWVGLKTFTGLGQQLGATYFNGSIAGTVYAALEVVAPGSKSALGSAIRVMLYLCFVVYLVWQVRSLWLKGSAATVATLAQSAGKVIFATLVLVTFWYQPWYITWLLPLAALAPDGVLRRHAVMLAFGGMLTYIIQYFAFVNQPDVTRNFFVQFFLVLVAFVPLLVLNHGGTPAAWRVALNQYLGGISSFIVDRPRFVQRLMLGLILVVAGLLRLIALGVNGQGTDPLHHISGNLSVAVADARGLEKLFALLQSLCVLVLGNRPVAVLLPSALIGTATVWLIASLAEELFITTAPERAQIIGLLAALFVATAQWHVALSRSGAQVVLLPFLVAAAALLLWRARRLRLRARQLWASEADAAPTVQETTALRAILLRRWPLLALMSVCVGLVSILEPTLWPLPVALIIVTLWTGWQRRHELYAVSETLLLTGITTLVALPTAWYYLARFVGFAPGSALLARSTPHHTTTVTPLSLDFWGHILGNLWQEAGVLVTQNYSAAIAQSGGIPILPALLVPFLVVGVWLTVRRGRAPSSLMLAVLAVLPFLVGFTVVAPASVTIAATALPIMCILPAIGLEAVAHWFASLPAVMSGPNNTVFISRENLLRVALLLILLIATVSTFFWYFANTIVGPTHIVRPA